MILIFRLCVVLVTENTSEHDPPRATLRDFASQSHYSPDRVRFAYLYHERQTEFINSLVAEGSPEQPILRIVIIWRRDTSHIKYEWLSEAWGDDSGNETNQRLEETIGRLLRSSEALSYEAVVKVRLSTNSLEILVYLAK